MSLLVAKLIIAGTFLFNAPYIKPEPITVNVQSVQVAESTVVQEVPTISEADRELLARLVRAEAEGEPFEGKVAVARVVLNRVDSEEFPNTIRDVIYQPYQFSPVSNGSIEQPATQEDYNAVDEALTVKSDSLYFYNPQTATSRWLDGLETTEVIGSHVFKK